MRRGGTELCGRERANGGTGMEISEHEYARLMQWTEQQQRRIAGLERENHELRRQVEDFRRGVGMAVVVQGRVIPVNPAPAEVPLPNAGPVPHPSFGPSLQTSPRQPPSAQQPPQPQYQPAHPMQPAQPAPRSEVFSEEMWITGQRRAVKAPAPPPAQRPISSSQEMTPSWLREDPPPAPAPRRTLAAATNSHPALPRPLPQQPPSAPLSSQQTGRQRVPARPLARQRPLALRLEPTSLPTLAQLTGHQPAVRAPGRQRRDPDEHTPYSDSFVLE